MNPIIEIGDQITITDKNGGTNVTVGKTYAVIDVENKSYVPKILDDTNKGLYINLSKYIVKSKKQIQFEEEINELVNS